MNEEGDYDEGEEIDYLDLEEEEEEEDFGENRGRG